MENLDLDLIDLSPLRSALEFAAKGSCGYNKCGCAGHDGDCGSTSCGCPVPGGGS
jgi:hypothetical protein